MHLLASQEVTSSRIYGPEPAGEENREPYRPTRGLDKSRNLGGFASTAGNVNATDHQSKSKCCEEIISSETACYADSEYSECNVLRDERFPINESVAVRDSHEV